MGVVSEEVVGWTVVDDCLCLRYLCKLLNNLPPHYLLVLRY